MNPPFDHLVPSGHATKRARLSQDLTQSAAIQPNRYLPHSTSPSSQRRIARSYHHDQVPHFVAVRGASPARLNRHDNFSYATLPTFGDFGDPSAARFHPEPLHHPTLSPREPSNRFKLQGMNGSTVQPYQLDRSSEESPNLLENQNSDHLSTSAHPYSGVFDTEEWARGDFYTPFANSICDASECGAQSCNTCGSCQQTCYSPCNNPDECSSPCLVQTCFDPSCLVSSQPSDTDDQTPPIDQCKWVGNGENCTAALHTLGEKVEHVTQSHINPQSQVTCQWQSCGIATDVSQLTGHIRSYHALPSIASATYPCLWKHCEHKFASHQELDAHMKAAHVQMNCHWAGCEVTASNPQALQSHFSESHLSLYNDSEQVSPQSSASPTIRGSSQDCLAKFPHSPMINATPQTESATPLESPQIPENASSRRGMKGEKTCQWQTGPADDPHECGLIFEDGNALQDHLRKQHISKLKPGELKCRWPGCTYTQTAKDKSKLNRHAYTHTSYCFGACSTCGQEFSEKSKLQQHEATHLDEKPFPCEQCSSRFATKNALTNHMRVHNRAKPLTCGVMVDGVPCSYPCSDPSNLSTHKKSHYPPEYKCPTCSRRFTRNDTMKRHMLIHLDKGPDGKKKKTG